MIIPTARPRPSPYLIVNVLTVAFNRFLIRKMYLTGVNVIPLFFSLSCLRPADCGRQAQVYRVRGNCGTVRASDWPRLPRSARAVQRCRHYTLLLLLLLLLLQPLLLILTTTTTTSYYTTLHVRHILILIHINNNTWRVPLPIM